MTMPPTWETPLKVWHLLLSIIGIGGVWLFTAASAWSSAQSRLDAVERKAEGIERIERNIVRIGATLKIEGLEVPK